MSELREFRLEEITKFIFDCPHSTPEWTDNGVIVLRNQNIRNGKLDLSSPSYTNEVGYEARVKRALPVFGDIVLTREAPMGEVCMIPEDLKCCLGQRMVLIRPDLNYVDGRYLLYSFQGPALKHQIGWNEGTGTTVSNIRIPNIKGFTFSLPSLSEQKAIAHILGTLDDKIELNRQMNQTLEAMAQALFKSWFVDFDPVLDNALVAGNKIPEELQARAERRKGLSDSKKLLSTNPALAAQFPDSFVFNEKLGKWIPEGWEVKKLQELVNVKYGKDHKKLGDGRIPCYGSGGVMRYVEKALFETESVLIPRKGTLNNIIYVNKPFWSVDTMFFTEMKEGNFVKYFFYEMGKLNFSEMNEGSAVPSMTTAQLNSLDIIVPSSKCLSIFDSTISKFFSKKESNENHSETLTQLRDKLLPELISGRVKRSMSN